MLAGHETEVKEALSDPDEIRRIRKDAQVFLFYRRGKPRWLCAVVLRDDAAGFLITAYPTDVVKAGETIWAKSE